ncbi:hypothetical protein F2P81_002102 [Scophthalmus maximus]|uniref:Uncharacterized protein n=1 Tax=Scophthalmus maximus TaxID=52904 RepID=A0A6A4THX6_SCOMX|nr:hypothetical protein F2P81_002102 [Scophthalmus maximus]
MVPPGAEALVKSPGGVSPRPQSVLTVQSMAPIIPHLLYGHTDVYRRYGVKIKALMDVKGRASVERSAASNHVCKVHNPLGDDTLIYVLASPGPVPRCLLQDTSSCRSSLLFSSLLFSSLFSLLRNFQANVLNLFSPVLRIIRLLRWFRAASRRPPHPSLCCQYPGGNISDIKWHSGKFSPPTSLTPPAPPHLCTAAFEPINPPITFVIISAIQRCCL